MKQKILLMIYMLLPLFTTAQYKLAVGARFDDNQGLSIKINKNKAISPEILLSGYGNGLEATFLAEWHQKAFTTGNWRWLYGVGGHIGSASQYRKKTYEDRFFQLGADGILGLEYTFNEVPLNLSIDWKPEFNVVNNTGLYLPIFGFSARFAVKR
jgi:hypothetical protein